MDGAALIEVVDGGRWKLTAPESIDRDVPVSVELIEWMVAEHNRQIAEIHWWKGESQP